MVSALHAHLVFVAKYRRDVLDDDMLRLCERVMRKACGDFGAGLREFNGDTDHVHLLVNYPPKVPVSALVNSLKGVSARMLRSQYTGRSNRCPDERALLVPVLLRRVLRGCAPDDHQAVHRAAAAPGLTAGPGPGTDPAPKDGACVPHPVN